MDFMELISCGSFHWQKEIWTTENYSHLAPTNVMSDELRNQVLNGHDGKLECCFTGEKLNDTNCELTWIVPPPIYYVTLGDNGSEYRSLLEDMADKDIEERQTNDARDHAIAANVLVMHKDFVAAFQNNQIMVDVHKYSEGLRPVPFSLSGALTSQKKPLVPLKRPANEQTIQYLRHHFSRGLLLGMKGGGLDDDYSMTAISTLLNDRELPLDSPKHFSKETIRELGGVSTKKELQPICQWIFARDECEEMPDLNVVAEGQEVYSEKEAEGY
ncbi:hypothetical protein H0H92_005457 [Tricholoma furcatifolium]|nr:hypothetical protein H0H92_005457 [Tricholoma furcatifolium]